MYNQSLLRRVKAGENLIVGLQNIRIKEAAEHAVEVRGLNARIISLELQLKGKIDEPDLANQKRFDRQKAILTKAVIYARWEVRKNEKLVMELKSELAKQKERVDLLSTENDQLNLKKAVEKLEDLAHSYPAYFLPDYYKILNVDRETWDDKMRTKYRQMMLDVHPDKCVGSDDNMRKRAKSQYDILQRGNKILQNPRLKYEYDAWLTMSKFIDCENRISYNEGWNEKMELVREDNRQKEAAKMQAIYEASLLADD